MRIGGGAEPDLPAAQRFIADRLRDGDATILLAWQDQPDIDRNAQPIGFAQLYPSFSSVACRRILILNDLYVDQRARGLGVGRALLRAAQAAAQEAGAVRLVLETSVDNHGARALYEAFGFVQACGFATYTLSVDAGS